MSSSLQPLSRLCTVIAVAGALACSGTAADSHDGDDDDGRADDPEGAHDEAVPPLQGDSEVCQKQGISYDAPLARRLTHRELRNTVRDTLGVDVSDALAALPPDQRESGFKNLAIALNVSSTLAEGYRQLAASIVDQIDDWDAFVAKYTDCRDEGKEGCARTFVESLGLHMFRQPLADEQIDAYAALFTAAKDQGEGFVAGARLALEAMAQAPQFLYRTEKAADGDLRPLTDWEVASRLSYLLWGSSPDDILFERAAAASLHTASQIAEQVDRLIADDRFRSLMHTFTNEWFDVDGIKDLDRDPTRYPGFAAVRDDMAVETESFVQTLLWDRQEPMRSLFTANFTIASRELAEFYGLEQDRDGDQYTFDDGKRAGLLTQGSVLAVHGGHDDPSLVERGLFIYNHVLCFDVLQAPPDVAATPIESKPGQTQRTAAIARGDTGPCGACHGAFDPLAFPFERFDGAGRYAETDRFGNELRSDGVLGAPIVDEPQPYADAREFAQLLSANPWVEECMTRKTLQFALGRVLREQDQCLIDTLKSHALSQGGRFSDFMVTIAMHPSFRAVAVE